MGAYAREFHERRKAMASLSPLSLERDEIEIKRIEAIFSSTPIEKIDAASINKTYARLRKDGMTPSALHKLHQKLSQVLKQTVKEEIIQRNPCDLIDDVKRPKAKERRSLTQEQAMQLAHDLKASGRNGRIVAVWLALATGVRRGEALGLSGMTSTLFASVFTFTSSLIARACAETPRARSRNATWLSMTAPFNSLPNG